MVGASEDPLVEIILQVYRAPLQLNLEFILLSYLINREIDRVLPLARTLCWSPEWWVHYPVSVD